MIKPSVCASVCRSVCLFVHEHISGTAGPIGTKFCVQIPVAEARPSSGSVALRYVLPVFTARAYARAVLGVVILSVCLSVCHMRGL